MTVKLTYDRLKLVNNSKREDPHIKLLIIDTINYLMSKLTHEDRRIMIIELYEMQLGNDGDPDQLKKLMTKKNDLEYNTLKSIQK